jgi:hypothetical protein
VICLIARREAGCAQEPMEYRIEDIFDVSAQAYWDIFFSDEYNAELWPALDIQREQLKLEKTGEGKDLVILREQRLTPKREVPKVLQTLVKGAITYVEKNTYRAADSAMKTVTIPSFGADRIDNHGIYRIEPRGEDKCARIWEGHCSCRIALLGGKIEKFLVGEIKESYKRATEFTRRYHEKHR